MTDEELQEKLDAQPEGSRVTEESITAKIGSVMYDVLAGTTLTRCTIIMNSGFIVTGESACVDPNNFDAAIGQKIAYRNAFDKLWGFEGYLLTEKKYLYSQAVAAEAADEE